VSHVSTSRWNSAGYAADSLQSQRFREGAAQSIWPAIGVENAKKTAAVALAEAKKNNWFMAVAVFDPSGTLVYYEKMDNTQTGSVTVAIEKARTAAMFKCPTKVFDDAVAGGGAGLRAPRVPGVIPVEGRHPPDHR
jgi:uncharacterized protein GlcG (DUF336 family)